MPTTKQIRRLSRVSRETLISFLDTLPDALFFIDDADVVVYANASTQVITGTAPEELMGKLLWRCAPQLVSTSLYQAVQRTRQVQELTELEYFAPVPNTWLHVRLTPNSEGLIVAFRESPKPLPRQDVSTRNEQMYRDLLESFSDGVIILTPLGLVLDINQRPLIDAQIQREEAVGRTFIDFPSWSYNPTVQRQLRVAIAQACRGDTVNFEARIHPRIDMYLDISMTITSHRDANQQIEYLICVGRDITERKRAEDELHTLIDAIPDIVWMMRSDGFAEYVNQRWCDYANKFPEQIKGDGWIQCLHPDDRCQVLDAWQTAVRNEVPYEAEHRIQDGKTGDYRWFLTRGVPLRDSQGRVMRWFGTCTDIDEQKHIEAALRQSEERAHALMDSNIIGIIVADGEEIVEANEAFLHMTGYSQGDIQQRRVNWLRMTPPEYLLVTRQAHQELALQQYMTPYEKEYICKDGSRLPVLVGGVTLQNNPLHSIDFVLDISARKELEQRKDDFISMASHELKTPITSIKLQTQLLSKQMARQGSSSTAPALPRMEIQIKRLERLIEELLDVSKIQAGGLEYFKEPMEMSALLQEVTETMQQMSTTHTIIVRGATPLVLVGDRDRLGQVFINLLSNAIKYSPDAETVEIDQSVSSEKVTICVHDHGLGIPREQCDQIFERFYRVASPNQKTISGLGMGLYIVAEIVKSHGGTITVDSVVGQGSTFIVTFPLKGDT